MGPAARLRQVFSAEPCPVPQSPCAGPCGEVPSPQGKDRAGAGLGPRSTHSPALGSPADATTAVLQVPFPFSKSQQLPPLMQGCSPSEIALSSFSRNFYPSRFPLSTCQDPAATIPLRPRPFLLRFKEHRADMPRPPLSSQKGGWPPHLLHSVAMSWALNR